MATKTIAGVKISTVPGSGVWTTQDGRFEFSRDDNAMSSVDGTKREETAGYGFAYDTTWSAWDTTIDDHAFNGETGYDTLTEAVTWVAEHL